MKQKLLCIAAVIILTGCGSTKEYVMPFTNFGYDGSRLFPVAKSDADFEFRAWVNFSTSIDRVFTVSVRKDYNSTSKLLEIRHAPEGKNHKDETTFKQITLEPKSGYEKFMAKVDSLQLMGVKDQLSESFTPAYDRPFSMYVIEIKVHGKTNQFRFNTYFPDTKNKTDEIYEKVQNLIREEFDYKFYFNKK
jgi:hypothetical protein